VITSEILRHIKLTSELEDTLKFDVDSSCKEFDVIRRRPQELTISVRYEVEESELSYICESFAAFGCASRTHFELSTF
jgi:hypothetical protein